MMRNRKRIIIQVAGNAILVMTLTLLCLIVYNKSFPVNEPINSNMSQTHEAEKKISPDIRPTDTPKKEEIERVPYDSKLLACSDDVYYGVYYFNNKKYYSNNKSKKTPSASVLKLFVMQYIYTEKFDLKEEVNGRTIRDLVEDMIQNSDNEVTNILIDRFGMKKINKFIKDFGYKDTVLARKMISYSEKKISVKNFTSLDDVMLFLKTLYEKRKEKPYAEMLVIMKGQSDKTKIPLYLPKNTVVANKTGEQNVVENDVGIVFTKKGNCIIAVLTNNVEDTDNTRMEIGKFAKNVIKHMPKK